jgi:CHASE2 domain-containing sensor protein
MNPILYLALAVTILIAGLYLLTYVLAALLWLVGLIKALRRSHGR